jgi:hypothetical protein
MLVRIQRLAGIASCTAKSAFGPPRLTSILFCTSRSPVCAQPHRHVTPLRGPAGAFTQLAAHLAAAPHLPADRLGLDQDLEPDLFLSGLVGLRELSAMKKAIGFLVERGPTIASAGASRPAISRHRPRRAPTADDPENNF